MPILSVDIFYTRQGQREGEKNDHENTMARFWHHAGTKRNGGAWTAELPLLGTDKPLWVYANVRYPLKEPITGVGYYYAAYTATCYNISSRMMSATPEQLKAAAVRATDKPSLLIESFEGDWHKEWFTYDLTGNWTRRTHKLYDPKWKAPVNAKLAFEVKCEQPNTLVVGVDSFAAEVSLGGGAEWRSVILTSADFKNADGDTLKIWTGIREFRLNDHETLANGKRKELTQKGMLGAPWKGPKPEFHNLRWIASYE
jgi:hypothetical protein